MPGNLSLEHTCLFFDVDGTLLDLAPKPEEVVVPPSLLRDLDRAESMCDGALALVSGRTIADIDDLFAPLRLRVAGVHGAEVRYEKGGPILREGHEKLPREAWQALQPIFTRFPGTFGEDKRYAYTVHYKPSHDLSALRAAVADYLADWPELIALPGHRVFEIKRPVHQKGEAIARFMARPPFAGRKPIFLGDDTTDEPGFTAALALDGCAYSVGREIPGLTGSFAAPAQVRSWLGKVAATQRIET